jgi:hypothetical protein
MKGNYYLMCVAHGKEKLENPYNVNLYPMDLKDKKRSINWMKKGGGQYDDFRVCKRISKTDFECIDTKEIFTIKHRGAYTEEAFQNFLNQASN